MGWLRKLLIKLNLMDSPIEDRKKEERRKLERRWTGTQQDLPRGIKDPRRKKERRKKKRRG